MRNSLYDTHFRHWLNYFPLEQFHIVDGDVFATDPLPELQKIESFLGLPHEITRSQLPYNATKGFHCFQHAPSSMPKCLGDSKGRQNVHIDDLTKLRLAIQLQPHNERFFELIQRRFTWQPKI